MNRRRFPVASAVTAGPAAPFAALAISEHEESERPLPRRRS